LLSLAGADEVQRLSNNANVELKKPDLSGTHNVHADAVLAKAAEGLGFRSWPISTPTGVSTGGTEAINLIIEKSAAATLDSKT
jgi:hypothetical protein